MNKYSFLLAAALVPMAFAAFAEVPQLDVEKTCHAAQPLFGSDTANNASGATKIANSGDLGNPGDANTYQNCMQSETAAKKSAGDLWTKVNASDRGNCVGLSRMVYPSYVELLSCLQMYDPTANADMSPQGAPRARTRENQSP